ncbi:unnamed protein product [Parajaminaea phylloscopi]
MASTAALSAVLVAPLLVIHSTPFHSVLVPENLQRVPVDGLGTQGQIDLPSILALLNHNVAGTEPAARTDTRRQEEDGEVSQRYQRPHKRVKREPVSAVEAATSKRHLFTTSCLFQIDPVEAGDPAGHLLAEGDLGQVTLKVSANAPNGIASLAQGRVIGVFPRTDSKLGGDSPLFAGLPVFSTYASQIPLPRSPWRATPGEWLLSAIDLANEGSLDLQIHASMVYSGHVLRLEVCGQLHEALCRDATDSPLEQTMRLPKKQLSAMSTLLRFVSASSDLWAEEQRRRGVSASAIYSILTPGGCNEDAPLQPEGLLSTLYPFQSKSTRFLLRREGKDVARETSPDNRTTGGREPISPWWEYVREDLYYNALTGQFCFHRHGIRDQPVYGALLAEEMGLGKTVEIIALVLLHPSPLSRHRGSTAWDVEQETHVQRIKATLIVAPDVLIDQWIAEIRRHAPRLLVYAFRGHQQTTRDLPEGKRWQEYAQGFDVIVASFSSVQRELNVALKERPRSRRVPRKYERPRSPLVQVEFFRVVADEIQMVGNTTRAAEVLSLIPRFSSIAVSGTPFKRLQDISALFRFLKVSDVPSTVLGATIPSAFAPALFRVLRALTTRHIKTAVRSEMSLPRQKRCVVPIHFTAVETAYYDTIWQATLRLLDLDESGAPIVAEWTLDTSKMRQQLLLLRQACTHPQVAGRVLGSGSMAQGNLRSLSEVLGFMQEQCASNLFKTRDNWLQRSVDKVVYHLQDDSDTFRYDLAAPTLEDLITCIQRLRDEQSGLVKAAVSTGPGYHLTTADLDSIDREGTHLQRDHRTLLSMMDARATHMATLNLRRRLYTEVLARAWHWLGNVYFQLGQTQSSEPATQDRTRFKDKEDRAYEAAEACRQELLKESREKVEQNVLLKKPGENRNRTFDILVDNVPLGTGGIQSRQYLSEASELIALLNRQAHLILEWRQRILALIYTPINREVSDDNPDDDQYAESIATQHTLEAILGMYRPLLAHRQQALTNDAVVGSIDIPSELAELESIVKVSRSARRQAVLRGLPASDTITADTDLDILPLEQSTKLKEYRTLNAQMQAVTLESLQPERTCLKELLNSLRAVLERTESQRESDLAKLGAETIRAILKRQSQTLDSLRRELDSFARLFNLRAEYFKQLQTLSDALVDLPVGESGLKSVLHRIRSETDEAAIKIAKFEAQARYLAHLAGLENQGLDQEGRTCIICTEHIRVGVLLANCGHVVCQKCFHKWYSAHRNCPVCRQVIGGADQYHRILYSSNSVDNSSTPAGDGQVADAHKPHRPRHAFITIENTLQRQIEGTRSTGRYGTKLDLLVKHLIYIGQTDPQAKTIVFSAFSRGLELVSDALSQNGLTYTTIMSARDATARIHPYTSGDVNILLLHSEHTSAGLNLMATKHLILLEPLVNVGAERQALGRVHRIGQTQETNVYCYYICDSVEDRILSLAAHRGHSLYVLSSDSVGEGTHAGFDEVDSGSVIADTASRKHGTTDYVDSVDDLLSCFFADHTLGKYPGV